MRSSAFNGIIREAMDKILLIDKPMGMTSFDVVRTCRRVLHEKKIGHTGTLDPNAHGFLIVLVGKYTKLLPFCVKDHKHYIARFSLGKKYDTQDIWGTLLEEREYHEHDEEELEKISRSFLGVQQQIPPMYSAVKVNGQKLYSLARKGIEVERNPREIKVNSLSVKRMGDNDYEMDAVVSSGTYIRTLIEDYCASMHEIGAMTSLLRVSIENLFLKEAVPLEKVSEEMEGISPLKVISEEWTCLDGTEKEKDIRNGKPMFLENQPDKVIFTSGNTLLAAYEKKEATRYTCVRGLF